MWMFFQIFHNVNSETKQAATWKVHAQAYHALFVWYAVRL